MNYRQALSDAAPGEYPIDPQGPLGLMIADQAAAPTPTPLDALIEIEEWLLEQHGMTFMQAVRAGVIDTLRKSRN